MTYDYDLCCWMHVRKKFSEGNTVAYQDKCFIFLKNNFKLFVNKVVKCIKRIFINPAPLAYGVVDSMFDFHRSDRVSNPGRRGKIS